METPMIKSKSVIKISKEDRIKIDNQKIADEFFNKELKESQ